MKTVTCGPNEASNGNFEPILQGKNVGWCPGPLVLVLQVLKVGGSDRPPADS